VGVGLAGISLNSIIVGGGVCIGSVLDCWALVSTAPTEAEELALVEPICIHPEEECYKPSSNQTQGPNKSMWQTMWESEDEEPSEETNFVSIASLDEECQCTSEGNDCWANPEHGEPYSCSGRCIGISYASSPTGLSTGSTIEISTTHKVGTKEEVYYKYYCSLPPEEDKSPCGVVGCSEIKNTDANETETDEALRVGVKYTPPPPGKDYSSAWGSMPGWTASWDNANGVKRPNSPAVDALVKKGPFKNAVAGKLYMGFSASTGEAFFYAAISKTSFKQTMTALLGQRIGGIIPDWLGDVTLRGFDKEACESKGSDGDKSACWAVVSFAPTATVINTSPALRIPAGLSVSAGIDFLGSSMGLRLVMSPDKFALTLQGPAIHLFGGALRISRTKDRPTLGPIIQIKASLDDYKFAGSFNAYVKFGVLAEGQLAVNVSTTELKFAATGLSIFGGVLKGGILADMQLLPPKINQVKVSLDVSKPASLLATLARKLVDPFDSVAKAVKSALDDIEARFKRMEAKLGEWRRKLYDAKSSCNAAKEKLMDKRASCDNIVASSELVSVAWGRRRRNDRRRRSWRERADKVKNAAKAAENKAKAAAKAAENKAKAAAKAAKAAAKAAARAVCRGSLTAFALVVKGACIGGLLVAEKGVAIAEKALGIVKKAFLEAKKVVMQIVLKVQAMIKFLTKFQIRSLGFEGGFDSAEVTLKASVRMDGVVKDYAIVINLNWLKDVVKFAKKLLKSIFMKAVDAAMGFLKPLKKAVQKLLGESIAAEEEMVTGLAAVTVEEVALLQQQQKIMAAVAVAEVELLQQQQQQTDQELTTQDALLE